MRARAAVEVTAGIIPGVVMPEHTRQWFLTEGEGRGTLDHLREDAHEYALSLPLPDGLNWVREDVIWF